MPQASGRFWQDPSGNQKWLNYPPTSGFSRPSLDFHRGRRRSHRLGRGLQPLTRQTVYAHLSQRTHDRGVCGLDFAELPRGVAQLGSALRSGRRGRGFESRHPDKLDFSHSEQCANVLHSFLIDSKPRPLTSLLSVDQLRFGQNLQMMTHRRLA